MKAELIENPYNLYDSWEKAFLSVHPRINDKYESSELNTVDLIMTYYGNWSWKRIVKFINQTEGE